MNQWIKVLSIFVLISGLLSNGSHGGWIEDGVPIIAPRSAAFDASIVSDGSGGAIVVYEACSQGKRHIIVRRIDSLGTVLWDENGVALCSAAGDQMKAQVVSDGSGGAIVAWCDYRDGSADIYAQRVSAAGIIQWAANGIAICIEPMMDFHPQGNNGEEDGAFECPAKNTSIV